LLICIGDLQLKEQGAHKLQRVLIPDPELSCFYPTKRDEFVIIATDGLWDVMTSQAAVDYARELLLQEALLGTTTCDVLPVLFVPYHRLIKAHARAPDLLTHIVGHTLYT
jgi:hypothetical protein